MVRVAMAVVMPCVMRVFIMSMMLIMMVFVPVMPKFCLVEQKEKHQAKQQGDKQIVRCNAGLKCLWQEVQKSGGQQSTRRQAQHVLGVATHNAKAKPRSQPNAADASGQCA